MKANTFLYGTALLAFFTMISCNDKPASGNTTPEGTQVYDQRPNQNDGSMSGNVDTITSPGSNVGDIKRGNTGTDPNMQNQSATHGSNTQSGDNGSGSTSATSSTGAASGSGR